MANQIEPFRDANWFEWEYNPRLTISDIGEILAARPRRADETRSKRKHFANIRTGQHPREVLDLFRADAPKGTFIFIHGGFWQVSSKDELSWIADGFVDLGYSTVLLNYPLCPEASLDEIVESIRRSFAELCANALNKGFIHTRAAIPHPIQTIYTIHPAILRVSGRTTTLDASRICPVWAYPFRPSLVHSSH